MGAGPEVGQSRSLEQHKHTYHNLKASRLVEINRRGVCVRVCVCGGGGVGAGYLLQQHNVSCEIPSTPSQRGPGICMGAEPR